MPEILTGKTTGRTVRFVQEFDGDSPLQQVEVEVLKRDWDVTDPEARYHAARAVLGDDVDFYAETLGAQWFIDEERNAAALCVYRLKT